MCETGAVAKGNMFIQVLQPGRIVDSHLKDHLSFLLKPVVLIGIGSGELFFFYPIILLAFLCLGPIHLSSFWPAWAQSIHLSSFWCAPYKNLPLYHTGQCGDSPMLPVYSVRVSGDGVAAGPVVRNPRGATALTPPPDAG